MNKGECQACDDGGQETYRQQGVDGVDEEYGGPDVLEEAAESDFLHSEHRDQHVRDLDQEHLVHGTPKDHDQCP